MYWLIGIIAAFGLLYFIFPTVALWLLLGIAAICIIIFIMFVLGISGAGTGESPGQVLVRFIKELFGKRRF